MDQATETALRSLHDIAIPPPISWLPQTWGWGLLAALLFLAIAIFIVRWFVRYRRNAYRREALHALESISNNILSAHSPAIEVAELLKRTALSAWPRIDVATLSSSRWIGFLEQHSSEPLGADLKALLTGQEYEPGPTKDLPVIVSQARLWIERHHV